MFASTSMAPRDCVRLNFRRGLWESGRMYRVGLLPFLALACAGLMNARPPAADLAGDWMGTLGSGAEKLRVKLHVTKTFDGLYIGKLVSIDQGNGEFPLGRGPRGGPFCRGGSPDYRWEFQDRAEPEWFKPRRKVDAGRNSATDLQTEWPSAGATNTSSKAGRRRMRRTRSSAACTPWLS